MIDNNCTLIAAGLVIGAIAIHSHNTGLNPATECLSLFWAID